MPAHFLRAMLLAATVAGGALLSHTPVHAQAVAAYVNGEPIGTHEIDQRIKVNRVARQGAQSRPAALKELIDDRLKIGEARRIGYRVTDDVVDEQITRIAKSNNQTFIEFHQNLNKAGVDMNAYKQKLKAAYAWDLALERRNKTSSSGDPLFQNRGGASNVIDYTLYSVVFVVPRGTAPGGRLAEANAARSRFNDCRSGFDMLRSLRDVAVKAPVRRSSDSLSPQLNKILESTPVNRLTQPFPSEQGIEVVAVCEKTSRVDRSGAKSGNLADELKKKQRESDDYLKQIRAKSVIQMR